MSESTTHLTVGQNAAGEAVELRIQAMVASRLLVQADSGGGKSRVLRLLAERLMDAERQVILIDPEGEFASLRERHDLVIVGGEDGDVPATVSMARPLAAALAETRVSAVLDLERLDPVARHQFVRGLAEGLIALKRDAWTELFILLDEAPMFAPERGQGDACSTDAIIDLATRGRKRGQCLIPATQRFSMLHKNVAALCSNVLIGPTAPSDQKRAAELAGLPAKESRRFGKLNARQRQFIGRGPAFDGTEAVELVYDLAETTHPEPGQSVTVAKPSRAMQDVLFKLAAIAEADTEREAADLVEAQEQVEALQRKLAVATEEADALRDRLEEQPDAILDQAAVDQVIAELDAWWRGRIGEARCLLLAAAAEVIDRVVGMTTEEFGVAVRDGEDEEAIRVMVQGTIDREAAAGNLQTVLLPGVEDYARNARQASPKPASEAVGLTGSPAAILNAMAWLEAIGHREMTKPLACGLAGVSATSGTTGTAWSELTAACLVDQTGRGRVTLTAAGREAAAPPPSMPTLGALHEQLKARLETRQIELLDVVIAAYPKTVDKAAACETVGHSPTSGTTGENWARLSSLGLIHAAGRGRVVGTSLLFPEGLR